MDTYNNNILCGGINHSQKEIKSAKPVFVGHRIHWGFFLNSQDFAQFHGEIALCNKWACPSTTRQGVFLNNAINFWGSINLCKVHIRDKSSAQSIDMVQEEWLPLWVINSLKCIRMEAQWNQWLTDYCPLTGHLIYININLRLPLIKCIIVICKFDNEGFFRARSMQLCWMTRQQPM